MSTIFIWPPSSMKHPVFTIQSIPRGSNQVLSYFFLDYPISLGITAKLRRKTGRESCFWLKHRVSSSWSASVMAFENKLTWGYMNLFDKIGQCERSTVSKCKQDTLSCTCWLYYSHKFIYSWATRAPSRPKPRRPPPLRSGLLTHLIKFSQVREQNILEVM